MTAVNKDTWKTKPAPEKKEFLGYEALFSDLEAERMIEGLKPMGMEDKWFIYHENGYLYLHRSWTGTLIYWLKLDGSPSGVRVTESWVNRDTEEYKETEIEYDRQMLDFLIRRMLLREDVSFPIRKEHQDTAPKGVYQHHIVGRAYPEKELRKESLWSKIKGFFK